GLVSFGHALFIGIGAYTGAFLTTHTRVRSLEIILLVAALAGAAVAALVGALCVRYVKLYFGMLTLAFGMVFYTFLLKLYRDTGGTRSSSPASTRPSAARCSDRPPATWTRPSPTGLSRATSCS